MFFSLVRKERKGQKEEGFNSRLGDADTRAPRMCQFPRRPAIYIKDTATFFSSQDVNSAAFCARSGERPPHYEKIWRKKRKIGKLFSK